jgi:hypothetical protein
VRPSIALSRAFLAGGILALGAALLWWWSTFSDVVTYGYLSWFEAGRCLASDSGLCTLAKKLCLGAHPRGEAPYFAHAFWIAFGLLSLSALTGRAPARAARPSRPG